MYSPTKHNGSFNAVGLRTFMGAPYCEPDRNKLREMGAKFVFLGAVGSTRLFVPERLVVRRGFAKHRPSISLICSNMMLIF